MFFLVNQVESEKRASSGTHTNDEYYIASQPKMTIFSGFVLCTPVVMTGYS